MGDIELKPGSRRLTVRTLGDVTITPDAVLSHLSIVCRNLHVNGRGTGSFRCSGLLNFATSLAVEGSVFAETLVIERGCEVELEQVAQVGRAKIRGKLTGKLNARGEVRITRGGQLVGDCTASQLTVEAGGQHAGLFAQRA